MGYLVDSNFLFKTYFEGMAPTHAVHFIEIKKVDDGKDKIGSSVCEY